MKDYDKLELEEDERAIRHLEEKLRHLKNKVRPKRKGRKKQSWNDMIEDALQNGIE